MKAHLMFRDADFAPTRSLPSNADQLIHDLDLETLFSAMAEGDELILKVSKIAVLDGLVIPEDILYRQDILADCRGNEEVVREIYGLAVQAVKDRQKLFWFASRGSPARMMSQSPQIIALFMEYLRRLRAIVDANSSNFTSAGWTTLFQVLKRDLSDEYFQQIGEHLRQLKFRDGTLFSARLSFGNTGRNYVLRDPRNTRQTIREKLGVGGRKSYSFDIPPRDEAGAKALEDLVNRGVNTAANSLAQAADHLANFFIMLRTELAFYIGCLNLIKRLALIEEPVCVPQPREWSPSRLNFSGLYDICLALRNDRRVVGNDANADGRNLIVVTGANSGGKSTFLRSVGIAMLMMRSGMLVAANSFESSACEALFSHFIREEDTSMKSGKLDEELSRMSVIADELTARSFVLFNESFSATNEREGSEIGRQVIEALLDSDIRAVTVTHLYDLANYFFTSSPQTTLFLKAEREGESGPTYRLFPGEPLPTSFAEDIYQRIGGW